MDTVLRPVSTECEEDEVLIGLGDFDGSTWESYTCGPARDDFLPDTATDPAAQENPLIGLGFFFILLAYAAIQRRRKER